MGYGIKFMILLFATMPLASCINADFENGRSNYLGPEDSDVQQAPNTRQSEVINQNSNEASSVEGASKGPESSVSECAPELRSDQSGLVLLSHKEYENTVENALGIDVASFTSSFPAIDRSSGFSNTYKVTEEKISDEALQMYLDAAIAIGEAAASNQQVLSKYVTNCINDETCFIAELAKNLFRSPATEVEVQQFKDIYNSVKALEIDNFDSAFQSTVAAMLMHPRFLFHMVVLDKDSIGSDRPLTDYEIAEKLSYFIWQSAPNDSLLAAAQRGELSSQEGIAKTVDWMLSSPQAEEGLKIFLDEWLNLNNLDHSAIQVSSDKFPNFSDTLVSEMKEEIYKFGLEYFLKTEGSIMRIFDAPYSFAGPELSSFYGVTTDVSGKYSLQGNSQRSGILTLSGLLASISSSDSTSPVERGLFLNSVFFCRDIPSPPLNSGAFEIEMEEVALTPRQRAEGRKQSANCNSCHQFIDPVGLALENYDAVGSFRSQYEDGITIDPSGMIPLQSGRDASEFSDLNSLSSLLKEHDQIKGCIVKKMFQFATRHKPNNSNSCEIKQILSDFKSKGETYASLVKSIATSFSFRHLSQKEVGSNESQELIASPTTLTGSN